MPTVLILRSTSIRVVPLTLVVWLAACRHESDAPEPEQMRAPTPIEPIELATDPVASEDKQHPVSEPRPADDSDAQVASEDMSQVDAKGKADAKGKGKLYGLKGPRSKSAAHYAVGQVKAAPGSAVIGLGAPGDLASRSQHYAMGLAGGLRAAPRGVLMAEGHPNTESYDHTVDNRFKDTTDEPLSTFSIDVDTASYANARRFIEQENRLPPPDAVRLEEFVNYFRYAYPDPKGKAPFSITTQVTAAPWNPNNHLVQIGLQGKRMAAEDLPTNNLVFLIDVSGSMRSQNKLPLLRKALRLVVDQLRAEDSVAIVVYAGAAGVVLPPTAGTEKSTILAALEGLEAGGSTAGAEGIALAYDVARRAFKSKGNNRVLLATDGDFNVGVSSDGDLVRLIRKERNRGVFLTVLGVGQGNYKDSKMEKLADHGNGNAAYIDSLLEARKVLVDQMGGTLLTIAKDVKIQVEFNPAHAQSYRLIGYQNRTLANRDFADDKKDAGELGAGHSVTALYEVVPASAAPALGEAADAKARLGASEALKYQARTVTLTGPGDELLTVKLRYKKPGEGKSRLLKRSVRHEPVALADASVDLRFASAVAEFAMLLRDSKHKGRAAYDAVLARAQGAKGPDLSGYRSDFIRLVSRAHALAQSRTASVDQGVSVPRR